MIIKTYTYTNTSKYLMEFHDAVPLNIQSPWHLLLPWCVAMCAHCQSIAAQRRRQEGTLTHHSKSTPTEGDFPSSVQRRSIVADDISKSPASPMIRTSTGRRCANGHHRFGVERRNPGRRMGFPGISNMESRLSWSQRLDGPWSKKNGHSLTR